MFGGVSVKILLFFRKNVQTIAYKKVHLTKKK
jgi:hypothetical protein